MKLTAIMLQTITLILSFNAFGHGEDKAGPNGGFIRMPGAFHTEVVPTTNNELKVYLLDINWKNPSTKNSSVDLLIQNSKLSCSAKEEKYFLCQLPKGTDLKAKGQLIVLAKREGQVGNEAKYDLPLKLQSPAGEHSKH